MFKYSRVLLVAIATALLCCSSFAADLSGVDKTTEVKADGSSLVTETLAPRAACPDHNPTIVQHYLPNGVKQSETSDLFCGSYVERPCCTDSLAGTLLM